MRRPRSTTGINHALRCRRILSMCAALALAAVWTLPALATDDVKEDYGAVRVGGSLYATYCTSCHGAGGEGDGQLASKLDGKPSDLTQIAAANGGNFPFEDVTKKIDGTVQVKGHGSSDMPIWGEVFRKGDENLNDEAVQEKMRALTHYLRSVQASE